MNWLREPDTEPIPGYRLIEPLGTGGFGEVWKCMAPGGIEKAIKFVFGNLNTLDGDSAKAEQEFKALERVKAIRHPFVVSMDRIEIVDGELLIVMELADKSLHDVFEEYKKEGQKGIPRDILINYLSDAAEGLDHLIEKYNLQHLDVKPKNLFLIAERVKVADFGLVRHLERQSSAGMMAGITPVYAAPETFANKVSKHSDQYSLAIVFAELLTGEKPFNGKNIRQLAMQHMMEPPDLSALSENDRLVIAKALAKNPEERYSTCSEFIRALANSDDGAMINTPAPVILQSVDTPSMKTRVARNSMATRLTGQERLRGRPQQDLSVTTFLQNDLKGVMRPAILLGIGSFGRRALQQIRCRLLDRIGQLNQVPCLRFIYLDPDPDAAHKATAGAADLALSGDQVFLAPLQQVTNYRRRQLEQILEWLPREKLYSITRALRVDGSRALGRLAFSDHYLRFMTRLRNDITHATHPESLQQSTDHTGLTMRTSVPVVHVFVSASGGTSGMLMDVGHAVRRALEKMNLGEAPIVAHVLTGSPNDANSPPDELANIFATLTELNHYADPDVRFMAKYGGPEGPQIEASGLPFTATYLLPMSDRSPTAFRDCVSHLAGYVACDLTTGLGAGLEALRYQNPPPGRTEFRGFGTFGVWYPRGLLLRSAARQVCIDLIRVWASPTTSVPVAAEQILDSILKDNRLTPEQVRQYIANESTTRSEGQPLDRLATWVMGFESQVEVAVKKGDPLNFLVSIWDQARDWLGLEPTMETDSSFRRGRLSRILDQGLRRAVEAWENELTHRIHSLEELPGQKLCIAEMVVSRLIETATGAITAMEDELRKLQSRRESIKVDVMNGLNAAQSGGGSFSLFGNRTPKTIRSTVEKIREFVDIRVKEDMTNCSLQFYSRLYSIFDASQRDYQAARDRLIQLSEILEAPLIQANGMDQASMELVASAEQTTLKANNTMRIVLPHGEDHLDRSAGDLIEGLSQETMHKLENVLNKVVLEPMGGLVQIVNSTTDLLAQLANPLVDQTTLFLSNILPSEDVTAVEHSASRGDQAELTRRVSSYLRGATPMTGGLVEDEKVFLLYPDSEPGRAYADVVKKVQPNAYLVPVKGAATDLLFCREQVALRTSDVFRMIDPCFDAYENLAKNVLHNPHSRFDVSEWLPLVE